MNERVQRLREESRRTEPSISTERARLLTAFYRENEGRYPVAVMRARALRHLCEHQAIWIGDDELIVGERGPGPKRVPTYPELTCHTADDLRTLDSRDKTRYRVSREQIELYEREVEPYWRGRSMRDRIFRILPAPWRRAYEAGVFTEFMEQRAPGHTTLDGEIYRKGLRDFQREIADRRRRLDYLHDPAATARGEELEAMSIACDAVVLFAERHAGLAEEKAATEHDPLRRAELERIAEVCRRVPAQAPRDFREAIQAYWFVHLGTIMELNGWDAMSPGHLDQHLWPFYCRDLERGALDREGARELLECLWIKFDHHPAPPKVGVTAEESGTYNDFTNINLGGVDRDGNDAVNELSYLMLEVIDEIHLLQPQANVQVAKVTPDAFVDAACRLIRKGYGYPALFNADTVVAEQLAMGKSLEDAREGGISGCIETGCFGKEAYLLTGYLNLPKILELALHDGVDPVSGERVGPATGAASELFDPSRLYRAFEEQLRYFVDVKVAGNQRIESLFARTMPAPFLSVLIRDCIEKARDYYDGGARYDTTWIQCCGLGTVTDSLSAICHHVFDSPGLSLSRLIDALDRDFEGEETLRQRLLHRTPKFGNDLDAADAIAQQVYESLLHVIDGRPNTRGGTYHLDLLSTTCHVYFGTRVGATPDGRRAGMPISDGTSPAHGADRRGPTAVCRSLARLDQTRSGGTLLNQRFLPALLDDERGLTALRDLARGYFDLGGHHLQLNVVDDETLRRAQESPDDHRDLLVRVAGYSDYFVDLGRDLQEEVIARTLQSGF